MHHHERDRACEGYAKLITHAYAAVYCHHILQHARDQIQAFFRTLNRILLDLFDVFVGNWLALIFSLFNVIEVGRFWMVYLIIECSTINCMVMLLRPCRRCASSNIVLYKRQLRHLDLVVPEHSCSLL